MNKQQKYAQRKAFQSLHKKELFLSLFVFGVFALVFGIQFILGYDTLAAFGATSLASVAVAAVDINGDPSSNSVKAGKLVKAKLYYIVEDQYDDTQVFPVPSGREIGNIPLKSGEYWHYIKTVSINNPEAMISGTLGDIGGTLTTTLKAICGGVDDATITLIEEYMGRGMYVVFEICGTGKKYLIGNGCRPAILQAPEGGFGKDNSSVTLSWSCESTKLFMVYVGNTPIEAPATIAANAITFALTANPQYQPAVGTASTEIANVTAITDADAGRIVTILGGGGSGPSKVVTGGNIELVAGTAWVGNAGSQISFKIYKFGTSTYKLVEIYGTRT